MAKEDYILKTETLQHKEAFEYYYSLGVKRSCEKVAEKFGFSPTAVQNWKTSFAWDNRVQARDDEIGKKLAAATKKDVLKTKMDYRKEIKDHLSIIRAALATAVEKLKNSKVKGKKKDEKLEVYNVREIAELTTAAERLVKLDLILMGEAADYTETHHTYEFIRADKNKKNGGNDKPVQENEKWQRMIYD